MRNLQEFIKLVIKNNRVPRCTNNEGVCAWFKYSDIKQEDILSLEELSVNTTCSDKVLSEAWSIIFDKIIDDAYLSVDNIGSFKEYFSDKIIENAYNNNFAICVLGHAKLTEISEDWLIKIYYDNHGCVEAMQTVALNYILNRSIYDCTLFFKKHNSTFICLYLMYYVIKHECFNDEILSKCHVLCCDMLQKAYKGSGYRIIKKIIEFIDLLKTNDTEKLNLAKKRKDYLSNLALSQNVNTLIEYEDKIQKRKKSIYINNLLDQCLIRAKIYHCNFE